MKTSKYILFAATFVLLVGLFAGAVAQRKTNLKGSVMGQAPEPIIPIVQVNAIEVTDGTLGVNNETKEDTAFGYTFLGRTSGGMPGSFTLSMNCSPAAAVPNGTSNISSGSWTLPVYPVEVRSGYAGSLYGTIAKGTMSWDEAGTSATVYIMLNIDGGTQAYGGVTGLATFAGTLSYDEKTQKTTLTGDLVFNMMSPIRANQ